MESAGADVVEDMLSGSSLVVTQQPVTAKLPAPVKNLSHETLSQALKVLSDMS